MKLLLDTHVFLWLRNEPKRVSKTALDAYQNNENNVFLSLVSIWEMQIKQQLGKIQLAVSLADILATSPSFSRYCWRNPASGKGLPEIDANTDLCGGKAPLDWLNTLTGGMKKAPIRIRQQYLFKEGRRVAPGWFDDEEHSPVQGETRPPDPCYDIGIVTPRSTVMATVIPGGNRSPLAPTDRPRPPPDTLPTMYDLPSEEPEEPGLPDEFHLYQPQLLRETFQPTTYPPEQVFVGSDLNLYYSLDHTTWYKRPDWFAVLGVSRLYEGHELRLSYVVWQEPAPPYLVVELLSPGKEQEDLGRTVHEAGEPPTKWMVYEQILRVPYYVVFNRYTDELHYLQWLQGRYREVMPPGQRLWLPEAGLGLGLWQGVYQGVERRWLRFYDVAGNWIATPLERENQRVGQERQHAEQERQRAEQAQQHAEQERQRAEQVQQHAEQERQRAEQAQQRAERLAARLRALGIEPDE